MRTRPLPRLSLLFFVALSAVDCGKACSPSASRSTVDASVTVAAPQGPVTLTDGRLPVTIPGELRPAAFATTKFAPVTYQPTTAAPLALRSLDDLETWKYFEKLVSAPSVASLLRKSGVAVDGNRGYNEFFQLYEQNRYRPLLIDSWPDPKEDGLIHRKFVKGLPSVVTPDVVLHHLHLYFDFLLAATEQTSFTPALVTLVGALVTETNRQLVAFAGTELEQPIRDNLVFLSVGSALLRSGALVTEAEARELASSEVIELLTKRSLEKADALLELPVDDDIKAVAKRELGRVLAAKLKEKPELLAYPGDFKEDYTQYAVRGHYTKTPALQAYFRAMMWFGRLSFSLTSDSAVRSGLMLSLAVVQAKGALASWQRTFDTITFLIGNPDDTTFYEWLPVIARVYGSNGGPKALTEPALFARLKAELGTLRPPQIQGLVTLKPRGPVVATTAGLRFFSQRSVLDEVVFQRLVDPMVPGRVMLSALELPAIFGSATAKEILAPLKLEDIDGYAKQATLLHDAMPRLLDHEQGSSSYAGWLSALRPLWQAVPAGAPAFMSTPAYGALRLSTSLASYAELKHDTILYAKQAIAEMGGPGFEDTEVTVDERGYVVPEVETFARIDALLETLEQGLRSRQLFPPALEKSYGRFRALSHSLTTISKKELSGEPLTKEEYELIQFIGGDLEHFWEETLIVPRNEDRLLLLEDNNSQLVADIFSGGGQVLHVATGYVLPVLVVFPLEGKLHLGRGGVMSFYELVEKDRLNDPQWRAMLREKKARPPSWTSAFMAFDPKAETAVYSGYDI